MAQSNLNYLRSVASNSVEAIATLAARICAVPAPTGSEQRRAEFVASLLRERGYVPEIDAVGNVYVRRGKRGTGPVLMLLAHTDTVFPIDTPLDIRRAGDLLYGPGIGDNSVHVATLIGLLDMLDRMEQDTAVDLVAVANVGEEGLGNLRGARAAVERYAGEVGAVFALDGSLGSITNAAVGSQRWRIIVSGPGGHSFASFGTPSAIHGLAKIIAAIADIKVPGEPRTTFNVGMIEGGTSVNTIAPLASALLDMRSTDVAALDRLTRQARNIVQSSAGEGLQTEIEVLGERPAGSRSLSDPFVQLAARTLSELGIEPKFVAASTDANIPMSLHIPSLCVGVTYVERAHTLEEHMVVPPIGDGLAQIAHLCIEGCALLAR
ncbi:MAG TPA: M20/M25/M40 family metallo-hydrolase [Ktedonobacteraceae bacterium]|nr:M20/M25/M40 family metallo-hydrolase [Ktedonobacteraceae bacterium]